MPMDEPKLVIPSDIPWDALKGRDLEECLYWLLDDLGAKDLEWRQGGEGQGGTDQGRDIEATFYVDSPDGELQGQRWWVEAKGRSRTLEIKSVRNALDNTLARADVDVVVVATNTGFSNPTRDWVADWQGIHPRPKVRLWDSVDLERMLSKHPAVVWRLFSGALTPQGELEVVKAKFWNRIQFASVPELERLWRSRASLELSHTTLMALAVSEVANGDVSLRPWAMVVDNEELSLAVQALLLNGKSLSERAWYAGANTSAVFDGLAYLYAAGLLHLPPKRFLKIVAETERRDGHEAERKEQRFSALLLTERVVDEAVALFFGGCSRTPYSFPSESALGSRQKTARYRPSPISCPAQRHYLLRYFAPPGDEDACPHAGTDEPNPVPGPGPYACPRYELDTCLQMLRSTGDEAIRNTGFALPYRGGSPTVETVTRLQKILAMGPPHWA